jgi:2-polyprenyl-3-methyl-5-hydroxy-6-metoxy-1,4-benzoquinol methylase
MGHFIRELCAHGVHCDGADFSAASVEAASARLKSSGCQTTITHLQDLPSALPSRAFDVVFLLETIEHLEPSALDRALKELARIVRVGGSVVVTTPNREDITARLTMCPDCGAIFHPIQHVSSWNRTSLASVMKPYGFEMIVAREYFLATSWRRTLVTTWAAQALRRTLPNLVYIGRRIDSSDATARVTN